MTQIFKHYPNRIVGVFGYWMKQWLKVIAFGFAKLIFTTNDIAYDDAKHILPYTLRKFTDLYNLARQQNAFYE